LRRLLNKNSKESVGRKGFRIKERTPENIEPVKEKVKKQDQYEMLKMNFLSQRKQAIENEIRYLNNFNRRIRI